jgi:large subunit ribosomal protein L23
MPKALHLYDIIRRPVITEASQRLANEENVYTFEVDMRANKPMIKEAVETVFGVEVLKVRTAIMPAKRGQRFRQAIVRRSQWKKAMVTVTPGQKIELFGV